MTHVLCTSDLLVADFSSAVTRVMRGEMTAVDLIEAAEVVSDDLHLAALLYQLWINNNPNDPLLHAMHFNAGIIHHRLNDETASIESFRKAVCLRSDFLPPYINLGTALERAGDRVAAVSHWMQVINQLASISRETLGYKTAALKQIGRVFEEAQDHAFAETALQRSLEIDPLQQDAMQHWISLRQVQCKWPIIQPIGERDRRCVLRSISPLSLAAYTDDPIFQLANSHRQHLQDRSQISGLVTTGQWLVPETSLTRPLRIGYISPDLREHAIGFLTAELFSLHNRRNVEVHAFYTGPDLPDSQQARIRSDVDLWTDLSSYSDKKAAIEIINSEIDVLVDLGGYTRSTRNKLFALRPAPIIVNWLGFPGSMGSFDHHYIIADKTVIPPTHERYYTEAVRRLPCYQPNARKRSVAASPSRVEVGLPEVGFVYCCFNGSQKFSRFTFQRWMRVLKAVPNAVLWLLSHGEAINLHLRDLAAEHGVAQERLVFAPRVRNSEHLARYKLADLFLDTSPYGAHTTASDAMWMGVPVITMEGRAFASRVCTSLVTAAGLPDLVTKTSEEYVRLAIKLGTDPIQMAEIKGRLQANRDTCLLFDTPTLVGHLEAIYHEMWNDYIHGRLPHPDVSSLSQYAEIGTQLDHEAIEKADETSYNSQYDAAIAYREVLGRFDFHRQILPEAP